MQVSSDNLRLDGDGLVLYSPKAETLYRLNSTAAYIWSLIEARPGTLTISELHRELSSAAAKLNLPGAESLTLEQTDNLIGQLAKLGLLITKNGPEGMQYLPLAVRPKAPSTTTNDSSCVLTKRTNAAHNTPKIKTVAGVYFLLAAIHLYLKIAGFNALLTRVKNYPTKSTGHKSEIVTHIAALDHAQVYYPQKQMCLQRSTALTLLLRRDGHFAQMVIGTQTYPPKAHAWVEVDNQVVADSSKIKSLYQELLRV